MLTTAWDQGEPYNALCPKINDKTCVTGCVATAMAQVMKFHKWPKAETTEIPSYKCANFEEDLPSLPATTFDWDNMTNSYDITTSTETEINAVAKLMQYCGWSIRMIYDTDVSGAYLVDVVSALENYFNYDETTQSRDLHIQHNQHK